MLPPTNVVAVADGEATSLAESPHRHPRRRKLLLRLIILPRLEVQPSLVRRWDAQTDQH